MLPTNIAAFLGVGDVQFTGVKDRSRARITVFKTFRNFLGEFPGRKKALSNICVFKLQL